MKKTISLLAIGVICLMGTYASAGTARQDTVKRLQSSVEVLHAVMATPDKGIPEEVLSNAKCILVVPDLIKGGFIFGGKHGRGVASCRTAEGWSAPAFVSVGGGSWGLQIGVEGVDLVMLVMNDQGFPAFAFQQVRTYREVGKHERHVLLGKGKVRIKANAARARCKAARQVGKRSRVCDSRKTALFRAITSRPRWTSHFVSAALTIQSSLVFILLRRWVLSRPV